jgi:endo-1,4-beta-xylanase
MRRFGIRQLVPGALEAILAGLFAIPACVIAQALPITPPAGYDQGGLYPAGAITSVSYYSPSQGTNDTMYVYLPPGYTTSRKYPVIYGYPGISAGADTIFAGWCVDAGGLADNLIGHGKIQPVIIVAIDDNNWDVQSDTLNVIIPYIDSHYSTYADADHRGLYGYSWGGMYTLNIGSSHLDTFHYLSPSSAAIFSTGSGPGYFPNGGAEAKQKMKCLLISCGTADWDGFYPPNLDLANYCDANGIPHYWWPVQGAGHDASVWRPAMWNFLQLADAAGLGVSPVPRAAFSQIEAESYNIQQGGIQSETSSEGGLDIGYIQNGSYVVYRNIDFGGGAVSFDARVASATGGGNIELHLDSLTGPQVGTCAVPGTGGWQTWVTKSCPISGAAGIHDLYLKFTGGGGYLFNCNWWKFNCTAGVDVGAVGIAGSASYSNGVFTVAGAGADIGSTTDAFCFVYATVTGDCSIIARVASLQNVDPSSKAGVMIRESLNANAANAFVAVTPGNGVTWQYRSSTGSGTVYNNIAGLNAPCWVKLVRTGNTFTGYYSLDGVTWTQQGTATTTMASTVYIGLAVSSYNNSSLCTATFDYMTAPNWPTSVAPAGLAATAASATQINLVWNTCTNATSYTVKRSAASGGPYTTIASSVTATNYQDLGLPGNTIHYYYYVVSAVVGGGETPNSAQAAAAAPWTPQDVGTAATGGTTLTNGVFTLTGSGDDIWNTADAFQFCYLPMTGNCTIVARVTSMQNIDPWSKAGVMIRESLAANAANVLIAVTPSNGVTWQYRSSTGGGSTNNNIPGLTAPYWVKLIRIGNNFLGFRSPDGATWTVLGSQTIKMAATAYVGLAVTAHNNASLCTATFDNVTAPGWPLFPVAPSSLTAIAGNAQVALSWPAVGSASSYNLKSGAHSGGPYTVVTNVTTTGYTNTGLLNGSAYHYVVSALNIAGESTNSVEASATPQAPPNLIISPSGTNFMFSWPVASADFTLQSCTNLAMGIWVNVMSPAPQIIGGQWQLTLPQATNGSAFYRLSK